MAVSPTDATDAANAALGTQSAFDFGGFLGNLFGAGATGAGISNLMDRQTNLAADVTSGISELQDATAATTNFTPFGVTSGTGNVSYGDAGQMIFNANPQMQPYIDAQRGNAGLFAGMAGQQDPNISGLQQQFYGRAGQENPLAAFQQQLTQGATSVDPNQAALREAFGQQALGATQNLNVTNRAQRESDIFSRIQEIQRPQQERDQNALDRKLQAQGRMGVRTNEFGGTPEQLALSKAQAEAGNMAAYQAMNQAGTEMDRDLTRARDLSSESRGAIDSILNRQMAQGQGASGLDNAYQNRSLGYATGAQNLGMNDVNRMSGLQGLANSSMMSSFAPESQLFNAQGQAANIANLLAAGQRQTGQINADLGLGGLQALIGSEGNQSQLLGQLYGAGGQVAQSTGGLLGDLIGKLPFFNN